MFSGAIFPSEGGDTSYAAGVEAFGSAAKPLYLLDYSAANGCSLCAGALLPVGRTSGSGQARYFRVELCSQAEVLRLAQRLTTSGPGRAEVVERPRTSAAVSAALPEVTLSAQRATTSGNGLRFAGV